MNENVTFALKWGLVLGLAIFATQKFLAAQAHKALPVPASESPSAQEPNANDQPFCEAFPDDPLCSSFGGSGDAWI